MRCWRKTRRCGIAYWGISLSDWSNPFASGMKDKGQLQLGRESAARGKKVGSKTERERAYVAAVGKLYGDFESTPQQARLLAYRDAMEEVAAKYPEDHEAQIFYALALAESQDPADKTYAGRLKAGAILEKLFEQEPSHPGLAHYIIHTYDVPALAGQALVAARRYSEIAPDAPHALHMPSHTFTRLGYWQESIDSNAAAAASARRQGPSQTAEELHASDYEIYAYLQSGQDQAAGRIVAFPAGDRGTLRSEVDIGWLRSAPRSDILRSRRSRRVTRSSARIGNRRSSSSFGRHRFLIQMP